MYAGVLSKHWMETEVDLGGTVRPVGRLIRRICSYIGVVRPVRFVRFYLFLLDADTRPYYCSQRNEDPAPTLLIEDALQDTSTAPHPFNHAPRSMKQENISLKEFSDTANVYCYNFIDDRPPSGTAVDPEPGTGVCVKHVFTGPYNAMKTQATGLFYQIQEGIELAWQRPSAGISEGTSEVTHIYRQTVSSYVALVLFRPILFLDIISPRLDRR
jgi:hypothetical protein